MEPDHTSYYHTSAGSTSFDTSPRLPPIGSYGPSTENRPHERKRRRVSQSEDVPIESIDLTEGSSALSKALAKQREDAVRAQQDADHGQGRSTLTEYKCPVCMDTPVDATSTVCGHLFCHKCIIDALGASEERRVDAPGRGPRGMCPVCRKPLARTDTPGPKRNLVPLQLKLKIRPAKRNTTGVDDAGP